MPGENDAEGTPRHKPATRQSDGQTCARVDKDKPTPPGTSRPPKVSVAKSSDAGKHPRASATDAISRYDSDPTRLDTASRRGDTPGGTSLPICGCCRHSDGRGQGHAKGDPRPPFAFKMSMISEFCNSHYLLAACCVFHRRTSRVIHHRELFSINSFALPRSSSPLRERHPVSKSVRHGNSLEKFQT